MSIIYPDSGADEKLTSNEPVSIVGVTGCDRFPVASGMDYDDGCTGNDFVDVGYATKTTVDLTDGHPSAFDVSRSVVGDRLHQLDTNPNPARAKSVDRIDSPTAKRCQQVIAADAGHHIHLDHCSGGDGTIDVDHNDAVDLVETVVMDLSTVHVADVLAGGSDSGSLITLSRKCPVVSGSIPQVAEPLKPGGDVVVVIEVGNFKIAGYTLEETIELAERMIASGDSSLVGFKIMDGISHDMREFLNSNFTDRPLKSSIQQVLRDNLYKRTIPCTTRQPRPGETDGEEYNFITTAQFLKAESDGDMLETGFYQGHYYGTPRPGSELNKGRDKSISRGSLFNGSLFGGSSSLFSKKTRRDSADSHDHNNVEKLNRNGVTDTKRNGMSTKLNQEEFGGEFITASLIKSQSGFGFTIIGGTGAYDDFLQVKTIVPGGSAALDGRLRKGDVLMYINDTCVLGYTHTKVVDLFRTVKPGEYVELTVCRKQQASNGMPTCLGSGGFQTSGNNGLVNGDRFLSCSDAGQCHVAMEIQKGVSGFGFTIIDCSADPMLDTKVGEKHDGLSLKSSQQSSSLRQRSLVDGGQRIKYIYDISRCGSLRIGDKLVKINNVDVSQMSHREVVDILKACPANDITNIEVARATGVVSASVLNIASPILERSSDLDPLGAHCSDLHYSINQFDHHQLVHNNSNNSAFASQRLKQQHAGASIRSGLDVAGRMSAVDFGLLGRNTPSRDNNQRSSERSSSTSSSQQYLASPGNSLHLDHQKTFDFHHAGNDRSHNNGIADRTVEVTINLKLEKGQEGFGFRLIGGREEGCQVSVGYIVPNGIAANEGSLQARDKIVEIDGVEVMGASHQFAVDLIMKSKTKKKLRLRVQRSLAYFDCNGTVERSKYPFTCTLIKGSNSESFGFVILSSINRGTSIVGKILDNSPSSRCRQMSVGDRILEVNGVDINQMAHNDVVNLIKRSGSSITLTIGAPFNIDGNSTLPVRKSTPNIPIANNLKQSERKKYSGNIDHLKLPSLQNRFSSLPRCSSLIKLNGMHDSENSNQGSYRNVGINRNPATEDINAYDRLPCCHDDGVYNVQLPRKWNGFGFSIRGGEEYKMPLYVLRIANDGSAQNNGRLQPGDEILEINGNSTICMSHYHAISLIKDGGSSIRMTVRRTGRPPPTIEELQSSMANLSNFVVSRRSRTPMI